MPELPEVETVKEILKQHIIGRKIIDITIRKENIVQEISETEFKKKVVGKTIRNINRRGKFILFYLDDIVLLSHLRMEGKYYIKQKNDKYSKHEHVIFHFENNEDLRYNDTRRFGTFHIRNIGEEFSSLPLSKLGVEPLSDEFNYQYIKHKIKGRTKMLKQFLLDQTIISGLGNIYVDEVMFRMGVHPETSVSKLTIKQMKALVEETKKVISKAILLGGSSIRSYTAPLGVTGRFQNELLVHMRAGQECYTCQSIIQKIKVGQRGTYVCERCQKKY